MSVPSVRVAHILARAAARVSPASGLPEGLVAECAESLPVSGVSLVLMTDAGPAGTVAATDERATTMEELQFTLGEGPCVDCSTRGRPVLVPDLAASGSRRWPAYTPGALDAGIRAIFALPLRVGGIKVGVLDLYRDRAGALTREELGEALSHADAATTVLLHLQASGTVDGSGAVVVPVVQDRAEVHQATGMVAAQREVSLAEALVLLRARAFASERSVVAVARDVLAGELSFAADSPGQGPDGRWPP